jgi:hypothetical protein
LIEGVFIAAGTVGGELVVPEGGGVVGATVCAVAGGVVSTEFDDRLLNPKLKQFLLGQPY